MFVDENILNDAVDLHVHAGPDYIPRYSDSIKLAREATDCGMKAIVIKSHLSSTVASAYLANEAVKGAKVFGGIALNEPTGGLNPRTVIATIKSGGKVIWLPTVDAEYCIRKAQKGHWVKEYVNGASFNCKVGGISIINDDGTLKEEVHEILRICKDSNVVLASGHISPKECITLAKESKSINFDKLKISHPNLWFEDFTIDILKELVSNGSVLAFCLGACSPLNGRQNPREIAHAIREVSAQNCCLTTDYGQVTNPSPTEGLRVFYYLLLKSGISHEELKLMIKENPSRMLSI